MGLKDLKSAKKFNLWTDWAVVSAAMFFIAIADVTQEVREMAVESGEIVLGQQAAKGGSALTK